MMSKNLKQTLCDKLVQENKVQDGDVIRHSYSSNRLDNGEKNMGRLENHEGLSPTLDTRCDCLGICVEDKVKLVGGVGEMKSNNGTQFYEQDRIYDGDALATAIPAEKSFHPYYQTNLTFEPRQDLTPQEIMFYIMGLCGIIEVEEKVKNEKRIREILPILWQEIGKKEVQWEIRRFWCVLPKKILRPNMYEQSIYKSWQLSTRGQVGTWDFKSDSKKDFDFAKCLFNMWEKWKNRYTPHRWELSKQRFEQFNAFMSQLPHETAQEEKSLCDMWETSKGTRLLRKTLYKIQEIWQSIISQKQSCLRIRKLTPLTCCRLMGFTDEDYKAMRSIGMSDAAIYHMAGDSLIVTVMISILGQMICKEPDEHIKIVNEYIKGEIIEEK